MKGKLKMLIKKSYEPFLYKFLAIAKDIFKKTGSKNIVIFGDGEKLKFIANNYAGIFDYHTEKFDREMYDFKNAAYEISSLPNDDIKLEKLKFYPCSDEYLSSVEKFFVNTDYFATHVFELDSGDECKIAKIVTLSEAWLCDDDLKFINKLKNFDVYVCSDKVSFNDRVGNEWNAEYILCNEAVEFDNGHTTASITLIFNTRYNPRKSESVQQKINFEKDDDLASEIIKEIEELPEKVTVEVVGNDTYAEEKELDNLMSEAEKLEEEFEDDFDPMLA